VFEPFSDPGKADLLQRGWSILAAGQRWNCHIPSCLPQAQTCKSFLAVHVNSELHNISNNKKKLLLAFLRLCLTSVFSSRWLYLGFWKEGASLQGALLPPTSHNSLIFSLHVYYFQHAVFYLAFAELISD